MKKYEWSARARIELRKRSSVYAIANGEFEAENLKEATSKVYDEMKKNGMDDSSIKMEIEEIV